MEKVDEGRKISHTPRKEDIDVKAYLSPHYQPCGSILKLPNHSEFYFVGEGSLKQGLIIIPDMMGWNSGRIRHYADYFAATGIYTVIPKLSSHEKQQDTGASRCGRHVFSTIFLTIWIVGQRGQRTNLFHFGEFLKSLTFKGKLSQILVVLLLF